MNRRSTSAHAPNADARDELAAAEQVVAEARADRENIGRLVADHKIGVSTLHRTDYALHHPLLPLDAARQASVYPEPQLPTYTSPDPGFLSRGRDKEDV